jgi:mRNA-degrading endonuclease RelE of RelBE toxin-antitoxin system
MPSTGAAHSSECRVFETDAFKKALARIGRYRVFYSLDEGERIVFVLTIDDRKDAYR